MTICFVHYFAFPKARQVDRKNSIERKKDESIYSLVYSTYVQVRLEWQ